MAIGQHACYLGTEDWPNYLTFLNSLTCRVSEKMYPSYTSVIPLCWKGEDVEPESFSDQGREDVLKESWYTP